MSQSDSSSQGRRRLLFLTAPFVVGAAAAAALLAGFGGATSSHAAATAQTAGSSASEVASKTASYDAETIYKKDSPGVVDITVTEAATAQSGSGISPFGPGGGSGQQAQAEGTGFVYDKQGDIITASHVVSGATKITVHFADGSSAKATLVGSDPSTDTAVIKVSVSSDKLTPLTLADSSKVEPGEGVVAIGSPFGLEESISAGIVSAIGRDIQAPNGYSIPNAIQTDAAINHGNSGGPLIDSSAQVVGVNVQIATDGQSGTGANAGVGFATPSNTVKTVADDLIAGHAVSHPYLGIAVEDATGGSGAQIGTVRSGSPAANAGLKTGDVIVTVDGTKVANANQLTAVVAEHQPGDKLHITIQRNGSTLTLDATLGTRPATATA